VASKQDAVYACRSLIRFSLHVGDVGHTAIVQSLERLELVERMQAYQFVIHTGEVQGSIACAPTIQSSNSMT
jgi:hypothetical protein